MLLNVPDAVECALLFDRPFTGVGPDVIARILSLKFAGQTGPFRHTGSFGPTNVLACDKEILVFVSDNDAPLDPRGFREALSSIYNLSIFPGVDGRVADHTGTIFITVCNQPPMPAEARRLASIKDPPSTPAMVELKIRICHFLAAYISRQSRPTAIHWCQSNQIVYPGFFEELAEAPFPNQLHVHPRLFRESDENGRELVGFLTLGAKYVIGREIVFKPSAAEFAWKYERAMQFLKMAQLNGHRVIPDGESFGATADEVIGVRHLETSPFGQPVIQLEVVRGPIPGMGLPQQQRADSAPRPTERQPAPRVFGKRKPG